MPAQERQQQFEAAIAALDVTLDDARIAKNFGFSNSARIIQGGLFACTNNLEAHSRGYAEKTTPAIKQFIFLCVLTFPPQDEVYFAIMVSSDALKVNEGLAKLYKTRQAELASSGLTGKTNNNVKFYITDSNELYFHNNEFLESLTEARATGTLDTDCLAKIDGIYFSIWPPAATASRSLLAREFVGYLGRLVGRQNVHELRAFPDVASVSPAMRRMPRSLALADIEAAIAKSGGHYPGGEIARYHAALNFLAHKHFAILSGLSGSGKTQLALSYARAVHGIDQPSQPDPFLFVCPVRPEWTDPTGLTGYYDVLSNRYVVPPFLEAVLVATAHPDSPVFLVLDEMNLARVEYYFSDVLSAIETRGTLQLHSNSVPLEGTTGGSIPAAVPMPQNLYITGTVNVDETTNPISDKVLDRAVVLDMSAIELKGFLGNLIAADSGLSNSLRTCEMLLLSLHGAMSPHQLGFGYRVAEEVVRYHAFAVDHLKGDAAAVLDDLMVQKVLVKLRGAEPHRSLLGDLQKATSGLPRSRQFLNRLMADLDEYGSFQASR